MGQIINFAYQHIENRRVAKENRTTDLTTKDNQAKELLGKKPTLKEKQEEQIRVALLTFLQTKNDIATNKDPVQGHIKTKSVFDDFYSKRPSE